MEPIVRRRGRRSAFATALVTFGVGVTGSFGFGQETAVTVAFSIDSIVTARAAAFGLPESSQTQPSSVKMDLDGKEESTDCPATEHKASHASVSASFTGDQAPGVNSVGVTLTAQALAQGGRTVKCTSVTLPALPLINTARILVSRVPTETSAGSHAEVQARINIQFSDRAGGVPYWLGVDGHAALSGAKYEYTITAPDGSVPVSAATDFGAQKLQLSGKPGDKYVVTVRIFTDASGNGSCCVESPAGTLVFRLNVSRASILSATAGGNGVPGAVGAQARIVGGVETSDFPAVGAILRQNEDGTRVPHCTGTLISPRTVLTAAHCLEGYHVEQMVFVQGNSARDLSTAKRVIGLTFARVPHETGFDYDPDTFADDIGIAYLETTVPSDFLRTNDLYTGDPRLEGYAFKLTFVGFGYDVVEGNKTGVGVKRRLAMGLQAVTDKHFSYGEPGKNTCNGDSGGPAFIEKSGRWILAGVVSYGDGPCVSYGVDVRVDHYLQWIKKNTINQ